MSKHTTSSITPGRIRKLPPGTSNTQPAFMNDIDAYESDDLEFDENYPIMNDVSLFSQQHHRSSVQRPNPKKNVYFTPQIKRKRIQDQATGCSSDSCKEQMEIVMDMLKDAHRKLDTMLKQEEVMEQKIEKVTKDMKHMHREKRPAKPSPPPTVLPVVRYNNRSLYAGIIKPTPSGFMKDLINRLFTKKEILHGLHEEDNERTQKIQEAIKGYFFYDDQDEMDTFWDYEGKIIRGNQRRGHKRRNKSLTNEAQPGTRQTTDDNEGNEESGGSAGIVS